MDETEFEWAVRSYWMGRDSQRAKQVASAISDAGLRSAVTGGGHLDEFARLLESVFVNAGFPRSAIKRAVSVELPGYYRPTKKWDVVVIDDDRLVAAIELKSQAGPSFGNNFNNRAEEAIGNAVDVWRAYEAGTFGPVRPWLGYIFIIEDCAKSTAPVRLAKTVFPVDPAFTKTSYVERYRILCQRLVRERLYDAACVIASSNDPTRPIEEPVAELSYANFVASIAGRAAYIKAL